MDPSESSSSRSTAPIRLLSIPLVDDTWLQFGQFFVARKLPIPPRPKDGVWVGMLDQPKLWPYGTLVAGACLYPTDGPFCVVEYASSNPYVTPRLAYIASVALIDGLKSYGAHRNMNMLCFPRDRSILRLLDRAGFTRSPAICSYHQPVALTAFTFAPKVKAPIGGPQLPETTAPIKGAAVKPARRK